MMEAMRLATNIVTTLVREGYIAYFAGGWVRDYLMGHPSDDIDIATDAPPEKTVALFPRTLLVGLAFGVVIVLVDGHQFEVATFRRDIDYTDGRKPTRIELSSPEEDASRRDFTINGMFYDPIEGVVHDYVHGAEDLKHQIIRAIGNPDERFVEDRLRMIRAVRFSARFGFVIDQDTETAIVANADTLFPAVAMERVWQEICKMAKYPRFDHALIEMHRLGLLQVIFPQLQGVHLNEIKHQVAAFHIFPKDVEPILYLLQLFPKASVRASVDLCLYLRTSNLNAQLAEFYVSMRNCVESEHLLNVVDLCAWAHFYAHPHAEKCLQVLAASMAANERSVFLTKHRERAEKLKKHSQRIINKIPLVNASVLQAEGVVPGRLMGLLIKEGEQIAILHDFETVADVLKVLKTTHLWPKHDT